MDAKIVARFWSKVDKQGPIPEHRPELGPCWVWTAGRDSGGRGVFSLYCRSEVASRVAWMVQYGPIPGDLQVLHDCDNGPGGCVRGDHLHLGTNAQNLAEMVARGRSAVGTTNGRAKLTDADVVSVRKRYATGTISQSALARELGVSHSLMHQIVRRKIWQHL